MTTSQPDFPYEDSIVWLEDVDRLDYVREVDEFYAHNRARPVKWRGAGRLVGYAVLKPDAPSRHPGSFVRRVFWVAKHDRDSEPEGTYRTSAPCEAVDPRTVRPGYRGELTERAWGRPFDVSTSTRRAATMPDFEVTAAGDERDELVGDRAKDARP